MPFTGSHSHAIDSKQRLAIPADLRGQVREQLAREGRATEPVFFYVTLGEGDSLSLYTEGDFERIAAALDDSELDADDVLAFENVFFGLAHRVEMDKNGRVRLPERLLTMAKLGSDVEIVGVKDHLEIRDRAAWQAHVEQVLRDRRELIMNPRRALRRSRPDRDSTAG